MRVNEVCENVIKIKREESRSQWKSNKEIFKIKVLERKEKDWRNFYYWMLIFSELFWGFIDDFKVFNFF